MTTPDSRAEERPRRDRRMSLGAHLIELRKRLLISVVGLVVGMVIAFIVTEPIIEFLTLPISEIDEKQGVAYASLISTTVTGWFDLRMRMALSIGFLLSAPVWLWQVWAFIMPGLTKKEIRYTVGFVGAAIPMFVAGGYVAILLAPNVIEMLASFSPSTEAATLFTAREYYDFILKFVLAIGVGFVIPVFLVALNFAGILSGRAIFKGWRVAVLVITLFAGITTPAADAFSMLLLGGVLVVLYLLAATLSLILDRFRRKKNPIDTSVLPA